MINWNIVPMLWSSPQYPYILFTEMEWIGKLSYMVTDLDNRIENIENWRTNTVEPFIESTKVRLNNIEEWRTNTVEPFIESTTVRLNNIEDWRTNTVEPFILATNTSINELNTEVDNLNREFNNLTKVKIINEEIPTPTSGTLGKTYTFSWRNSAPLCSLFIEFSSGNISLGAYPFNSINIDIPINDSTVHKTYIQMITGAYTQGGTGTIAYCTISYYINNEGINIAITDGYTYDLATGASQAMASATLDEITVSRVVAKFYTY